MDRGVIAGHDLENNACTYAKLADSDGSNNASPVIRRTILLVLTSVFLLAIGSAFFLLGDGGEAIKEYIIGFGVVDDEIENATVLSVQPEVVDGTLRPRKARGVEEGVSSKESGVNWERKKKVSPALNSFIWTNDELRWQRTAYHFQPEKNWMNDPNGPLYYKGWYHLFYQYNPESAVWGNITWGHAVSRDLIHWLHLPLAMIPDHWYDADGAWTGSATILPNGQVVMLYTGSTDDSAQVQNLALPADRNDPLLVNWVKSESNPVLFPPSGIDKKDFRDPTTAWYEPSQSAWRIAIGSKDENHAGITLLYQTKDFVNYDLLPQLLHLVPGTGMWECVDFYPVAEGGMLGLDTSDSGPEVKHVLKASFDDDRNDYYAIGSYDAGKGTWTPDDPLADVGHRYRYDYGKFYAAKTFYDQETKRRVLWGWIGEADSETSDIQKGWASIMGAPRTVRLDEKTRTNLLQWPVEEVERLRIGGQSFSNINIPAGSVVPLDVGMANQLDITVEFEVSKEALKKADAMADSDVGYNCSSSAGAAGKGALGPFGLLVLADEGRTEQTAVYFYIKKSTDEGKLDTFICQDETRSSMADDIVKKIAGSFVPVLDGEKLSLRVLVDHSIVETFAQGGRTCITSRVYPTRAIYGAAKIFLFNNATDVDVKAKSVNTWEMSSAFIRAYNSPDDK